MAGIIPSTSFLDVAFSEDLLLFMKGQHDKRMIHWLGKIKEDDKILNPFMHNYWTHKDLLDLDSDSSSDSRSDSDEKETDDESESKDSEFMDDVDVEGEGKNNMIGNPKRTVQKVSGKAAKAITSKFTGLESSKADANAPAENDGERKPQNEHGKKLVRSDVEIAKHKDFKVSAKVPDDGIQNKIGGKTTKESTEKASAAGSKRLIDEISKDNTDATLAKTRPKKGFTSGTFG